MEPTPSRAVRIAYVVITLLFCGFVVAGSIQVAPRLLGLLQDASRLSVPAETPAQGVRLPETFEIAGTLPVTADLIDPNVGQRVIATVPTLVWWALAVAVLWLLRGVARSAADGDPFRASNALRLRWLGMLFLLGFPFATIVGGYFTEWLFSAGIWTSGPLPPGGIATGFSVVSAPAILAAVSLFALAEVFAYGARLREDVDATI